jgi:hypothetical protein
LIWPDRIAWHSRCIELRVSAIFSVDFHYGPIGVGLARQAPQELNILLEEQKRPELVGIVVASSHVVFDNTVEEVLVDEVVLPGPAHVIEQSLLQLVAEPFRERKVKADFSAIEAFSRNVSFSQFLQNVFSLASVQEKIFAATIGHGADVLRQERDARFD